MDGSGAGDEAAAVASSDENQLPPLDPVGARVLGSLIEKETLVPQSYPLTINSLVSAANQSTSREPVMNLAEIEISESLTTLRAENLIRIVHPTTARGVTKYRHVVQDALRLGDGELALLALMLLRGPQTTGELRSRSERFYEPQRHEDAERWVDDTLAVLAGKGLAFELPRRPGQSATRWTTPWGRDDDLTDSGPAVGTGPVGGVSASAPPATDPGVIAELRATIAALTERVERLERDLGL